MRTRTTAIALLAGAALAVGACGEDEGDTASTTAAPAPTATAPATTPETTTQAADPVTSAKIGISKNLEKKPEIPKLEGAPPAKLLMHDVVKGKGEAAKSGDMVTVRYVGVSFSNGEQFDASWDRPENEFEFPLGGQMVIAGWDQGVAGMRKGGRRTLVIPPDLAYGDQPPQGAAIAPGETLVFVIDLLKIA